MLGREHGPTLSDTCWWRPNTTPVEGHLHYCDRAGWYTGIFSQVKVCSQYQWRNQPGAPTLGGGTQHTILPSFPKNWMKLKKEFGHPGEGGASLTPPLDPPLNTVMDTGTRRPAAISCHYTKYYTCNHNYCWNPSFVTQMAKNTVVCFLSKQ